MVACGLRTRVVVRVIFFFVGLLWIMSGLGLAQQEEIAKAGKPTYEQHCAVCHGISGKGDGVSASVLTVKPADLTQLSKKSNGKSCTIKSSKTCKSV